MGKSTVLNCLIGDERMETFKAGRSPKGVTRDIQIEHCCKFLGDDSSMLISVVDIPGIGDPTLDVTAILSAVEKNLKTTKIDIVLLVLKATDDRFTFAEVMVLNMLKLLKDKNPENIVVIFTRCYQENPPDALINERLKAFTSSSGIRFEL